MTTTSQPQGRDQPLVYHIRVRGVLDPSWSARLEGLHIEVQYGADLQALTLLSGTLQDQSALNGVLATLFSLGFTILSVEAH
jgi:hypothetical protein